MEKRLIITGGVGIDNTWNDTGRFEVKYSGGTKVFINHSHAAAFYNDLQEPATISDKTNKTIVLEQKDWAKD